MSDSGLSDEAMRVGLLVETAQAQQRLGEESLARLAAHMRDLDDIVRDEVRRTVAEALGNVSSESRCTIDSLRRMRRAANARIFVWTLSIAVICSAVSLAEAWWLLPSQSEIARMRARRDALSANIARLQRRGGMLELRTCGARARLCVRVDRSAPMYGANADYLVVKGY